MARVLCAETAQVAECDASLDCLRFSVLSFLLMSESLLCNILLSLVGHGRCCIFSILLSN